MSLRTMPLWVSTLTPFEPSPGYGPAVSSGIAVRLSVVAVVVAAAPVRARARGGSGRSRGRRRVAAAAARGERRGADAGDRAAGEQLQHPPARHHRVQVEGEAAIVVVHLVVVMVMVGHGFLLSRPVWARDASARSIAGRCETAVGGIEDLRQNRARSKPGARCCGAGSCRTCRCRPASPQASSASARTGPAPRPRRAVSTASWSGRAAGTRPTASTTCTGSPATRPSSRSSRTGRAGRPGRTPR